MGTYKRILSLSLGPLLLAAGCSSDKGVTVRTEPPAVSIANPANNSEVDEGVLVQMLGKVKDAKFDDDLGSLAVYWSVDGAAVCTEAVVDTNGDTICEYTFLGAGSATIGLSVTNPDSETASASSVITVLANAAPSIAISSPEASGSYYSDQLISFEALASDAEDPADALTVSWTSSVDGSLDDLPIAPTSDGNVSGATQLTAGEHLITATVSDTTGRTGSDTVTVQIGGPNNLPLCSIDAPASGAAFSSGDSVDFEASASDEDVPNSELSVAWESDRDGPLGESNVPSDGQITFSTDTLSSGTHTISMIVVDEVGGECTDTVRIQVGDEPFVILDDPSTGDIYNEGEDIIFQASVSDANDDVTELDFVWESSLDGVISTQGAGSSGTATFAYSALSAGTHTLGVTVTDPLGFSGYDSATFTVNGLPGAPAIALEPDPPQTGDNLRAVVETDAEDPEGDAVSYSYTWKKNGLATADTSAQIDAADTTRGDTWEVTVTASDPYGTGGSATASVTVVNTAPVLSDVSLSPDPAGVDDTLSCTPGASSDADGDSVSYTYAWSIDGSPLPGVTGATLSGVFSSGDSVTCAVTPSDGIDAGAAVSSNTVTIDNSPPVLDAASLSPAVAYEDTTLVCTPGASSDTDGDSVSFLYTWVVAGVSVAGAGGDTLTGADFDRDQEVYCRITPFDGSDYGAAVDSNTLTIHNTPPELDSALLGPDPAYTGDSLTCTAGSASDIDGDSVSYAYQWEVDGAVQPVYGAILSSSYTARGDLVTCTMTPSDGTDDGLPVTSDALTIANTAPAVSSLSISPASPSSEDALTATAAGVTDADGDSVSLTYTWYINGSEITGVSGDTLDASYTSAGDSIYAVVVPSDGTDAGAPVTSSAVGVENSAPVIGSVSLSPTTAYETSTLSCTVDSATDTDGDSISYTYAWSVGGAGLGVSTESIDGAYFSKGDTVTCSATPYDGSTYGDAVTSNAVTIQNSAPSVASVTVSPDPAYTTSSLSCAYSGAADDDPGDTVSVSYLWEVNGTGMGSSSALSSASFSKGDAVVCTVTPSDGEDSGSPVSSAVLTIQNSAPSALSATIDPSSPYTGDDLSVSVSGWSDADADAEGYLYAWYVNGTAAGSSATLSSSATARGDAIYVVVTPYDGTDGGPALTASTVTVQNSAPSAPTISISPAAPEPGEGLSCNIDTAAVDDDGDAVSYVYSWTLNTASTAFTSATIPAGETLHGDTWTCAVYATDGTDSSSSVSTSVNISDTTPPDAPVIGTPSAYTNEDVITLSGTCEADCELLFYLSDDAGSWTEGATCGAGDSFTHTVYATRGYATEVYATCTDAAGNVSSASKLVQWEVCDPVDEYDWSTGGYTAGYGDDETFLIDEWPGRLTDTDQDSLTVVGNILDGTDRDLYLFTVADAGHASGSDYDNYYENYNFVVDLTTGGSDYNFFIYSYDGSSLYELTTPDKVSGGTCDYTGEGFDSFDWYSYDATWSDTRTCRDGDIYSDCPDYSGSWVIEVVRASSSAPSCQGYELTLSNGIW